MCGALGCRFGFRVWGAEFFCLGSLGLIAGLVV